MTQKRDSSKAAPPDIPFDPVPVRRRRDGWTPERQAGFIEALAECGCVVDACRRVGMSAESAYALERRPDAQSFRVAWQIALDYAVRRIGDRAYSRAIHGVAVPHYYQGELIGEHRRYDERLTMFLLRYRDSARYGKHLDRAAHGESHEEVALTLQRAVSLALDDAFREREGFPRIFFDKVPDENDDDDHAFAARHQRFELPPGDDDPGESAPDMP